MITPTCELETYLEFPVLARYAIEDGRVQITQVLVGAPDADQMQYLREIAEEQEQRRVAANDLEHKLSRKNAEL
jgi:hypothetical protein